MPRVGGAGLVIGRVLVLPGERVGEGRDVVGERLHVLADLPHLAPERRQVSGDLVDLSGECGETASDEHGREDDAGSEDERSDHDGTSVRVSASSARALRTSGEGVATVVHQSWCTARVAPTWSRRRAPGRSGKWVALTSTKIT